MQYLQNLIYKPTANNRDVVAAITLDGAVDLNWTVAPVGSIDGQPGNVDPGFVAINNITGKFPVTVVYGPFTQICPAYQTQVFQLPQPVGQVRFTIGGTETVQIYFDKTGEFVATIQNLLAIQQAARGVNLYPFIVYNAAGSPQQTQDANSVIEFVGVAVNITYALLQVAGNVGNGWFQFVFNNGTRPVTVLPFGGDTINAIFTNAVPLILYPGEWGTLNSDGTQWFLKVFGQKKPSITYTAFSTTQQPNDIGKRLVFSAGAGQSYNLEAASTFANGDAIHIKNIGPGTLAILPVGVETINGLYTNAAPLYLNAGDKIDLYIDESLTWQADGIITFESGALQFGESFTGNVAHNMGRKPDTVEAWLRCTGAEINYVIGDEFKLGIGTASTATNGGENVVSPNAVGIFYTISPNGGIRLPNKTTAASSNIATAGAPPHTTNFALFFRAQLRL